MLTRNTISKYSKDKDTNNLSKNDYIHEVKGITA